jgi:GxxExxY protein
MDFVEWRERRGESADEESERLATLVIGAFIEVHKELGAGHAESTYEKAMCHELELRGIPFQCQAPMEVKYKGRVVGTGKIDLLVGEKLILELKSVEQLNDVHRGQVIAYLTAKGLRLGLLMNFNVATAKNGIKRVVLDPKKISS